MRRLLTLPASTLAHMVRTGQVTPRELVDVHIARIREVEPTLNAVTVDRFAAAMAEADAATERVAAARAEGTADALPPFFGVPCTVKEFHLVAGMPRSGGLAGHAVSASEVDAEAVARLRRAGAIILALTNVPEGGLWMETYNVRHGRTNNPWDPARTPGGSSGGEGALVGAGASPFGLGSDIGGSIRIPAAFCGVYGHKPTGRMVPTAGHWAAPDSDTVGMLTSGPLARSARDLMPLLRVLAGPAPDDPRVEPWALGDPADVAIEQLTVYVRPSYGALRVRSEVKAAVQLCADALAAAGATVKPWPGPPIKGALMQWFSRLQEDGASYAEVLRSPRRRDLLGETAKLPAGRSRHTLPGLAVLWLERVSAMLPDDRSAFLADGRALRDALDGRLGERAVLLHPTFTRGAPRHRHALVRNTFDAMCTAVFNVTESPVSVVPAGRDRRDMPIGVQIVAARGRDHVAIAAAEALERAFGAWTPAMWTDDHTEVADNA